MNKIKRFIAFLLVPAIIFSLYGCFNPSRISSGKNDASDESEKSYNPVEKININLPYISGDSLDPYLAKTEINRNLTPLLYDSLFEVGNDFKAYGLLAESFSASGNSIVVTIKSNQLFSDGSPVTVSDIVASFDKAKQSERYQNDLRYFEKAEAIDNNKVSFTVSVSRRDMVNLLTFPIIKTVGSESDELIGTTEEENIFAVPAGSGRYFLTKDKNNVNYLCCNTKRLDGYFPEHRNIGLVATVDSDKISSLYNLGRINFIMDTYAAGEYSQTAGTPSKIIMPNFIYLVCSCSNLILKDVNVKKAISYAIDRKELCDYCFIGNALPTELPFHPNYYKTSKIKAENNTYNDAIRLLESCGYTGINNVYNFRYNEEDTSKVLEFRLAVCKNNAFKVSCAEKIKEELSRVNIRIEIYKYEETDFFNVLSSGGYDMYIGESRLSSNLDLSAFFTSGNTVASGINSLSESASAYSSYQNGSAEIEAFIDTFKEDLPFIPILFRTGNIYSNSLISVADVPIITDYYNNIDKWKTTDD